MTSFCICLEGRTRGCLVDCRWAVRNRKGLGGGLLFVTGAVKSEVSEMGRNRLQERSQELSMGHVQSH